MITYNIHPIIAGRTAKGRLTGGWLDGTTGVVLGLGQGFGQGLVGRLAGVHFGRRRIARQRDVLKALRRGRPLVGLVGRALAKETAQDAALLGGGGGGRRSFIWTRSRRSFHPIVRCRVRCRVRRARDPQGLAKQEVWGLWQRDTGVLPSLPSFLPCSVGGVATRELLLESCWSCLFVATPTKGKPQRR
jgi:hypothetical protein